MHRLAALGRRLVLVSACLLAGAGPAAPPLAVYGNRSTFEIAPVLLAVDRLQPGAPVRMGGVPNLFGAAAVAGIADAGRADVATNAETQALRVSVANPDLRIVMTVSEGLYRIVARRSARIATVADLRGKRIATFPATSSAFFLHKMLARAGVRDEEVTVVPVMPLSDLPKALAERRVDAVTIWEPEIENAKASIGADAIEFDGRGVYRELFNLNTTATALRDPAKRRRIVALVRATIEASRAIRARPAVAWPLVAAASGYRRDVVARSWRHHAFPGRLAPDLLDVMVEEEAWLAEKDKRPARSRAELARLIDPTVVAEAMAR